MKTLVVLFLLLITNVGTLSADALMPTLARDGFNDVATWPGPCQQGLTSANTASAAGIGITATNPQGSVSAMQQVDPWCTEGAWIGNFAPGDNLLWTGGIGWIELLLSEGVAGIGTQFQANSLFGHFTATLSVYQGNTLLGSATNSAGYSTPDGDNSAIFLGIFDLNGANITRAVMSLDSCTQNCNDFAINQISLLTRPHQVPEPSSMWLLGIGLVGLVFLPQISRMKLKSGSSADFLARS